jgi:hypothetical protein
MSHTAWRRGLILATVLFGGAWLGGLLPGSQAQQANPALLEWWARTFNRALISFSVFSLSSIVVTAVSMDKTTMDHGFVYMRASPVAHRHCTLCKRVRSHAVS